jgi:hypothetical protein
VQLNEASKIWQEMILLQQDSLDNLKEYYDLRIDSLTIIVEPSLSE